MNVEDGTTTEARERGGSLRHWLLDAGLALLVVAVVIVLAVPGLRTAVADFFTGGPPPAAVDRLPATGPLRLDLGEPVSLEAAEDRAGFNFLVPSREGYEDPDAVFFRRSPPGGTVSFVYGSTDDVRLVITQQQGGAMFELTERQLPGGAILDYVQVGTGSGAWVRGNRGAIFYRDIRGRIRTEPYLLRANALLLERGPILIRLEGTARLREATRILASLR